MVMYRLFRIMLSSRLHKLKIDEEKHFQGQLLSSLLPQAVLPELMSAVGDWRQRQPRLRKNVDV
eukprot:11770572-Prorocentrum_lima.AAC.1